VADTINIFDRAIGRNDMNIQFTNKEGTKLSARLELPADKRPMNFAIFAHCFTCNKNYRAVRQIGHAMAAKGFGVLSFDFTGLGESGGEFSDSTFSGSVDDLIAAAEYLTENHRAPALVVGHSLGGSAALLAASRLDSVKAVVTIGAPAEPQHVKRLFLIKWMRSSRRVRLRSALAAALSF
jgi:alpha/beta superfamily hydrolase